MILMSKEMSAGVSHGIELCINSLIPSLYFFMIVSNLIMNSRLRFYLSYPFRLLSKYIFRLDDTLFTIFLLSALGGYPVGAKLIGEKVAQGEISQETGQQMLYFCINCSPAFLISFLSVNLWNSISVGVILFAAQMLSCIVIAWVSGLGKPVRCVNTPPADRKAFPVLLVDSVNSATKSMAVICSFVLVFCALFPLLDLLPLKEGAAFYLKGFLEVTTGCEELHLFSAYSGILLAAIFTSFGGLCVLLQVFAMLAHVKINFLRVIGVRFIYCALSLTFTYLGLQLFSPAVACAIQQGISVIKPYTSSPAAAICMLLLSGMLLLFSVRSTRVRFNLMKSDSKVKE